MAQLDAANLGVPGGPPMTWIKAKGKDCITCSGSGWVEGPPMTETYKRYIGNWQAEDRGSPTWSPKAPYEDVEVNVNSAAPCPDCNKFLRSAYEDVMNRRSDEPDKEQVRQRNIEKAAKKWNL
jgi:NMD protein affecting ribosome stability and mRNA decay